MFKQSICVVALFGASAAFGAEPAPEFRFWDSFDNSVSLRSYLQANEKTRDVTVVSDNELPYSATNDLEIPGTNNASVVNEYVGDLLFKVSGKASSPLQDDRSLSFALMESRLKLDIVVPEGYSHATFYLYQPQAYSVNRAMGPEGGSAVIQSNTSVWLWGDDGDFSASTSAYFGGTVNGLQSGSNDVDFFNFVSGTTHFDIRQTIQGILANGPGHAEFDIAANWILFRVTYFKNPGDTSGYSVSYDGHTATAENDYTPPSWSTEHMWTTPVPEPSAWLMGLVGLGVLGWRVKGKGSLGR